MTSAEPTGESAQSSLKNRVISGSAWTLGSYGASQVLRLAANIVLSALLFPKAFGLMAMVNVFVLGLTLFSDIGIGPSIVQSKRGEDPVFLNTAWTIQVARGFVLWIVSVLGANSFAVWYGEPQLASLIPVAALAAIISGFSSTRWFTASRRIAVARLTIIDFVGQSLGVVATVIWCMVTRTVWAIVFGSLIGTTTKMILTYVALEGETNRFAFDKTAFRELTHFGRWVFVSTALSFLTSQIDKLMLGAFVPLELLGVYNFAAQLAALPPALATALTGAVLFPLLAHHSRTDVQAYERAIFDARRLILDGALFLLAGLALVAPAFFRTFYDSRYEDAGWMTQLLTVPMWTWILMISADRAVLAVGESKVLAFSNAASLLAKLAVCGVGFHLGGVTGFILGLAVGNLAGHIPIVIALARQGIHILRQDVRYTAMGIAVIGGSYLVQRWLGARTEILVAVPAVAFFGVRALKTSRKVVGPMSPRVRLILARSVFALGSALIAVALLELGLRATRSTSRFLPYHKNSVQKFYPSEEITPGITGVSSFSTNRFGCRGPELDGERVKLLTIGGSTTACTVLDDSETWPQLLMNDVNQKVGDPKYLWVTNSGMDGKNSRHHVMHARYLVPLLPKLDFVMVYSGLNDAGSWLYRSTFDAHEMEEPERVSELIAESFKVSNYTPESEPWYKHLELWKRASIVKDVIQTRLNLRPPRGGIREDAELRWMQAERENRATREKEFVHIAKRETLPVALEFYANNLRTITKLVREAGAEPIFMTQATQTLGLSEQQKKNIWMGAMDGGASYLKEEEMEEVIATFNRTMADVARSEHVHLVDLEAMLRGHPEYYYDSCHFNELGARVAADHITVDLLDSVLKR